MSHLSALRERLRTSLWFIPSIFALAALIGGLALIEIDRRLQTDGSAFYLYGGTPEGARNFLSTIAQSMLTFTGLVFTVTMLVLQLASSQLSPRVLRTFLADRQNQVVLGLFVATFIFTLVVLRDVRSTEGQEFVPSIAIWTAFVLLGASVGAFIYYINHMAHAIRASSVIANIADDTEAAIDRVYPAGRDDRKPPVREDLEGLRAGREWRNITSESVGSVVDVDEDSIVNSAEEADALVELVPRVGDFVARGTPLFRVGGGIGGEDAKEFDDRLRGAVTFGRERTMQQDPAFGFRQLVDVGARALSPGTNDPTTCVQAIDRLHDLLLQLAERPFPSPLLTDEAGRPRVIIRHAGWEEFVRLAVDELRLYGERHVRVVQRLKVMLESVAERCPPDRVAIVRVELNRLQQQLASLSEELGEFEAYRG